MNFLWFVTMCVLYASVIITTEAKKGKYKGDFEFIDEEDKIAISSQKTDKKKWIHDPSSDLCRPLNCKKKELCLLEDLYTAVCVLKKEIQINRDIIISKSEFLEEEAKRKALQNDDNESQDDTSGSDEEVQDDEIFYDTELMNKDDIICKLSCKGFCPCKEQLDAKKLQRIADRQNDFNAKYKKTLKDNEQLMKEQENDDYNRLYNHINTQFTFTPKDIKFDNKHYKYLKYSGYKKGNEFTTAEYKVHTHNEVIDKPQKHSKTLENNSRFVGKVTECKSQQLITIGNRLLDWFSVIMADSKKRRQHSQKSKAKFPPACKTEAKWMFGHLDLNNDGLLSLQELYDLEHDQNERCIKPFIDTCDLDQDNAINTREWCRCFEKTDRPCAAVRRRIVGDFIGAYAPDCDSQGFYKPTQCHNSVGVCWCVDKHGVEFANTRTRGKAANCKFASFPVKDFVHAKPLPQLDAKKLQRIADRQNDFNAKYKKTLKDNEQLMKEQENDDYNRLYNHINTQFTFTPKDIKFDNKHYKYLKYSGYKKGNEFTTAEYKVHTHNEVIDKPQKHSKTLENNSRFVGKVTECKSQQLITIGNRLLDWFSVIMADSKKRRQHSQKSKAKFPPACKTEAKWMFGHLDLNNDGLLSLQELYDLEHDQNERCIKPFIDTCDLDQDNAINTREWCRCFEKTDRPCAAVRRRIVGDFIGAYAPDCDSQGFYKPTQCHNSVGVCWCVDKHGVEFANTRTRGKAANCKNVINNAASDDVDGELDDDDSTEGSADQILVF